MSYMSLWYVSLHVLIFIWNAITVAFSVATGSLVMADSRQCVLDSVKHRRNTLWLSGLGGKDEILKIKKYTYSVKTNFSISRTVISTQHANLV